MTRQPELFATFKQRVFAFLLDFLFISIYFMISIIINWLFDFPLSSSFSHDPIIAQILGFCWITLPVALYFFILEFRGEGTLGKQFMGIKIVHHAHKHLNANQIFIRTVVKFLPWELSHFVIWRLQLPTILPNWFLYSLLCTVYVLVLINLWLMIKKKTTLHDLIAKTNVRQKKE